MGVTFILFFVYKNQTHTSHIYLMENDRTVQSLSAAGAITLALAEHNGNITTSERFIFTARDCMRKVVDSFKRVQLTSFEVILK